MSKHKPLRSLSFWSDCKAHADWLIADSQRYVTLCTSQARGGGGRGHPSQTCLSAAARYPDSFSDSED